MREGQVFNGNLIQPNYSIEHFLNLNYGLGLVFKNIFKLRFESDLGITIKDLNNVQFNIFIKLLYNVVPKRSSLKKRCILNLYLLDLITSYRGWRHFKGLPTRGQRTWSNASTASRCNTLLRNYRVKISHRCYGNLPLHEVSIAVAAEQINLV
jgi:ribosomal protein S13